MLLFSMILLKKVLNGIENKNWSSHHVIEFESLRELNETKRMICIAIFFKTIFFREKYYLMIGSLYISVHSRIGKPVRKISVQKKSILVTICRRQA